MTDQRKRALTDQGKTKRAVDLAIAKFRLENSGATPDVIYMNLFHMAKFKMDLIAYAYFHEPFDIEGATYCGARIVKYSGDNIVADSVRRKTNNG